MHIKDINEVNQLIKVVANCQKALDEIPDFIESTSTDKDAGGVDGFEYGYSSYLTPYHDGSGCSVDLSGCYVARQVAEATKTLLEEQILRVGVLLEALGVQTGDEVPDEGFPALGSID